MNVKELKILAKKKGIKGYYKMRKKELEDVLNNIKKSPSIKLTSAPKKFRTKKFSGIDSIETYASILYLAELFKDECIIIPHSNKNKYIINKNAKFHDITLTWDEKKNLLWEPVNFWNYIKECDKSTKRFIMIPFGFECKKQLDSHANFLIYDKYKNTLERFEPHGTQFNYDSCMRKDIDEYIHNIFRNNFNNKIKYYKPVDYLPVKGFQYIQEREKIGQLVGYCGIWSSYYAILRLNNPDIDRKLIVEKAIKALNNRTQSYSEFIRDYGQIVKKLACILKKSKTPEKDFINYVIDLNQDK